MKKILPVIAILLVIMSFSCAFASQEMINPYFQEANSLPAIPMTFSFRSANRITVELTLENDPSLTADTVFSASASGGNGGYDYCFYLLDPNETSDEYPTGNPHGYRSASSESTFSYRLVVPGDYTVLVYVRDDLDSNWDAAAALSFTVEDPNALTTDDVIDILVSECEAAGCDTDFEKALWFHDWLTNHAYYDMTYSYYSADGVLIRGCGVCDSYSKAYLKLLNAVGIASERVTNVDHAWNLVKLDGEWYHIDPTWDDPVVVGKETTTVSGAEYHMYFGLPDRIMQLDRTFKNYSSTTSADSMDNNYYLKTGKVALWTDPLEAQINDGLAEKGYSFDFEIPSYYLDEDGSYTRGKEIVVYNIAAHALSDTPRPFDSQSLPMTFSYDHSDKAISASIAFSTDTTLTLPSALKTIGDEAFMGSSQYLEVNLSGGVTTIGDGAFSENPRLWKINIPDSVTSIADTAFSGSDNVTILCNTGSCAETFAKNKGIKYRND